jgi:catecholate siderophore receptor
MKTPPRKNAPSFQPPSSAGFSSRGRAGWIATGTFVAYTALRGSSAQAADATEPPAGAPPSGGGPGAIRAMPVRRFQIPPGPLAQVLQAFAAETGVHVEAADPAMLTMMSSGVSGIYTAELALKQLLFGMGLSYRFTSPQSATVLFEAATESVEVTAAPSVDSPKYTEPLRDTPQSVDVVTRDVMDARGNDAAGCASKRGRDLLRRWAEV